MTVECVIGLLYFKETFKAPSLDLSLFPCIESLLQLSPFPNQTQTQTQTQTPSSLQLLGPSKWHNKILQT